MDISIPNMLTIGLLGKVANSLIGMNLKFCFSMVYSSSKHDFIVEVLSRFISESFVKRLYSFFPSLMLPFGNYVNLMTSMKG
jgi:hypothetical protein